MAATEVTIGSRVVRVSGGRGYEGNHGEVVEISGERLRVRWDEQRYPYDVFGDGSRVCEHVRPSKRTWVKRDVVRPA